MCRKAPGARKPSGLLLRVMIGVANRVSRYAVGDGGKQTQNGIVFRIEGTIDQGVGAFDFAQGVFFSGNDGPVSERGEQQNIGGGGFARHGAENFIGAFRYSSLGSACEPTVQPL